MVNVAYTLYDEVEMKKEHPCSSHSRRFQIVRLGADIKIRCLGCGNTIMSAFALEPDKVMFHLIDPDSSAEVIKDLGAHYPDYRFSDPSLSVKESLEQVISYIDLLLRIASIVTLAISGFLLLTVALLTSLENRHEGKMLFTLGIAREDVAESYGATLLILTLSSAALAMGELVGCEYLLDREIQNNFGTSSPFNLDLLPLGGIALASFLGLFIAFFLVRGWVYRRDFSREGR